MVLIAAYLVLTCGFGYLGYLENIEQRVRGHDSVYYFSYIHHLNEGGIGNFKQYAKRAYEMSPNYRNAILLYSLSCMLSGDHAETLRVFQCWYSQRPEELLARWGLAEFLVKDGKNDEAEQLFRPFAKKGNPLSKVIYGRIINREKTLVDQAFFDLYDEKLKNIRVE